MQDDADGKSEAEEQPGLMEDNDVAEQMEAQDFMQPQAEQPELQVPEDLNLDNDAMDQENADGADAGADGAEQEMQEVEEEPAAGALHELECVLQPFAELQPFENDLQNRALYA